MRIYRASSLGGCTFSQIADHLGYSGVGFSEHIQRVMREGDLHENDVIAQLTAEGYSITRQQEEVNLDNVQGHLDGVLENYRVTGAAVLEVKSMSDAVWKEFRSKGWEAPGLVQKYKWQLSAYMLATGLEALLVAKNRNSGELLRMGVEVPFYNLDDIRGRVEYMESWVQRGELPPTCDGTPFFCQHRPICPQLAGQANEEEVRGVSPGTDDEFSPSELQALGLYTERAAAIKALQAANDLMKPAVEALLGGRKSRTAGGYRVTRVRRELKERVVPASVQEFVTVKKLEGKDE